MPKLDEYKNPITGQTGRVGNFRAWPQMILGVVFLMFIWQLGQGIFGRIRALLPGQVTNWMGTGVPQVRSNANASTTDAQAATSVRVF